MHSREIQAMMTELAPVLREFVVASMAPALDRIKELESRAPQQGDPGEPGAPGEPGKDGTDGRDGADGVRGEDGADGQPGADGKDGRDGADGAPGANGEDGKEGAPGKDGVDGKDGIGLAGALIDRSGALVVTLSDGTARELGPVVGSDGKDGAKGADGRDGADGKDGRDGEDGLGFDDLTIEHDGERGFKFKLQRGERIKEFAFNIPTVIDRGVWRDGEFKKGDFVTWAGSGWIAQRDTSEKPETSDAWRLSVKRGRDGKDGRAGERGPEGQKGRDGRDLTQVGADGAKW